MQPLSAVTVRTMDARGERVEAFDLLYGQLTGANRSWLDYTAAGMRRVEGGVVLEDLRRGEHVLLLVPRDEALAVAGRERFVVGDGPPGERTVRVPDRVALRVEAVDAAGKLLRIQGQANAMNDRGAQMKYTVAADGEGRPPKSLRFSYPRVRSQRDVEIVFHNVPLPTARPE